MAGNGGKPKPGGAQIIKGKGAGGATQVQPAFASVTSVTPREIAVSPEEPSRVDDWPSSAPCVCLPDGIALGPDGDAQAPITSPTNTTNKVDAQLNTFDILDL